MKNAQSLKRSRWISLGLMSCEHHYEDRCRHLSPHSFTELFESIHRPLSLHSPNSVIQFFHPTLLYICPTLSIDLLIPLSPLSHPTFSHSFTPLSYSTSSNHSIIPLSYHIRPTLSPTISPHYIIPLSRPILSPLSHHLPHSSPHTTVSPDYPLAFSRLTQLFHTTRPSLSPH